MMHSEPTEEQVAHRRFLQWQYGQDKIQELKSAGVMVDIPKLRYALIAKIDEVGLTQMQHEDTMALLDAQDACMIEELIMHASSTVLCAILWATNTEALLPA